MSRAKISPEITNKIFQVRVSFDRTVVVEDWVDPFDEVKTVVDYIKKHPEELDFNFKDVV